MQFCILICLVLLCLTTGAVLGASIIHEWECDPLIGGIVGSLAGVVIALAIVGEVPNEWDEWLILPPHDDESAESI